MDKCKPVETPIALGNKVIKNDDGPIINLTLYKNNYRYFNVFDRH